MLNDFVIIIQARTGSTRLPNKMTLPFYKNKGIFEILIIRLLKRYKNKQIYLATTCNESDNVLIEVAKKYNINYYRGDENNVLSRFTEIIKLTDTKRIIRVCADNPFLDINHINKLVNCSFNNPDVDYVSYSFPGGTPTIMSHIGLFAELVVSDSLNLASSLIKEPIYKEHVTNYIYTHIDKFNIKLLKLDENIAKRKGVRLTLDTEEDFYNCQQIWNYAVVDYNVNLDKIFEFIDSNEEIKQSMKNQIVENSKK